MPKEKAHTRVSPNNSCPFLRALVQHDLLRDDVATRGDIANTIVRVAKTGEGAPKLSSLVIGAIAIIANGLGPASIANSVLHGVQLNALRNGPLDKKGAGSGILDTQGRVQDQELERLAEYASDKETVDGTFERGLNINELTKFMDANFARAIGNRRNIDRKLMNAEWPVILKVMGKDGKDGRYVSVAEIRSLFQDRTFPERMMIKIRV